MYETSICMYLLGSSHVQDACLINSHILLNTKEALVIATQKIITMPKIWLQKFIGAYSRNYV